MIPGWLSTGQCQPKLDSPPPIKAGRREAAAVTERKNYLLRDQSEQLDGDMQPANIVGVLARLKFRDNQFQRIEIDGAVRDYLVAALSARRK